MQNQLNSTNKSLQTAKAEREALESTLASQAVQLSSLKTQLASAKASYETETALLNALRERHAAQAVEIQKTREELIRDESDLSAVRVEKAEIEGSFLRDKEEVRDLNRRMAEVTMQITVMKQEVEKLKKDAKQQKGLLAIAKKQLVTKESEKAKTDKELEEAQQDLTDTVREREEAEAEVTIQPQTILERSKSPDSVAFAAAHPLPVTPDTTGHMSPASVKSNNPFERLVMTSGLSTPRSQSPFPPFVGASYPPPPGLSPPPGLPAPDGTAATQADSFSFSQAFGAETEQQTDIAPDTDVGAATPRPKDAPFFADGIVPSPKSEQFATPPTSVTPVNHEVNAKLSSLDSAAAHFPAIDDFDVQLAAPDDEAKETDLSTDLQEVEVNDTESDSDEDSRDGDVSETVDHSAGSSKEISPSQEAAPSGPASTFDDIFGVNSDVPKKAPSAPQPDTSAPLHNGTPLVDAFGIPFPETLEATQSQTAKPEGSGLHSFDEALGKISNSSSVQSASGFSFDSSFEDNFDFGTAMASTSTFPPPSSPGSAPANGNSASSTAVDAPANGVADIFTQSANNGISVPPKGAATQPIAPVSFDEAFIPGAWQNTEKVEPKQANVGSISFEEAFGGVDVSQALKLDNSYSSRTSRVFASSSSPAPAEGNKAFPTVSPPGSPTSPRVTSLRSNSPQQRRTTSPPPRAVSPKAQRPSTSSSKEAHEKHAPAPRHSKLSVRLIFFCVVVFHLLIIGVHSFAFRLGRKRNRTRWCHRFPRQICHRVRPLRRSQVLFVVLRTTWSL